MAGYEISEVTLTVPWPRIWCGSTRNEKESAMIYERITAWMLVAVYYTVFLGVIVLGLRGAL